MMSAEDSPKRSNRALLILSLASLGFAGGTATLAYQKGELRRVLDRLSEELSGEKTRRARSEEIARGAQTENERLRDENRYQEGVIDLQTRARQVAERRAKQASDRALAEKRRADLAD